MKKLFAFIITLLLLITALPIGIVQADDGLDVHFERVYESPVTLIFEVTVTNTTDKVIKDLPLEVLFNGLPVSSINEVSIERAHNEVYTVEKPIYEDKLVAYKSVYGIYTLQAESKETESKEQSGNYFIDYDKKGAVLKEGYYETFDKELNIFYWTEQELIRTDIEYKVTEVTEDFKSWYTQDKTDKLTAVFNQPSVTDNEYLVGYGVQKFYVKIKTPLLTNVDGWGSKGLMVWNINGVQYYDDTNSSWWDTDWLYKQNIVFDNTASSENLIDFPVGVFLDNTNFDFSLAQADGDDIRFLDGETDCAFEIVSWDYSDDGIDNDSAEIWVKVPQVDAGSDTDYITMFWGNASCASGEDVAGTWNAGYVFVSHMNDNGDGTGILDSTSNENHGTKGAGTTAPTEVDGLVGKAQSFDGINDSISTGYLTQTVYSELTVEYFGKLISLNSSGYGGFVQLGGTEGRFALQLPPTYNTPYLAFRVSPAEWSITTSITIDEYTSMSGVYYGNAKSISLYKNGSLVGNTGLGGYSPTTFTLTNPRVQISPSYGEYVNHQSDEVRISSIARSEDWIEATNLTITDSYVTFGTVEGKPLPPATFTAEIDGNNIVLDWTNGTYATGITIYRGEVNYPKSITDGIEVYTGTDLTYTETGLASDGATYYYSAWGTSDWGTSTNYSTTKLEGFMSSVILFGILIFASIVLSVASFVTHRGAIAFVSTLLWLTTSIWAFTQAAGIWNIYMILGFVGIVMMIIMPIEAMFLNKGEEAATDKLEEASAMQQALDEMDAKNKAIAEKRMKGLL